MLDKWIFYGTPVQFSNATELYWNLKTPRIPCRANERESNEDRVILQFQVQGIWAWVTAHTIPQGRSNLVITLRDKKNWDVLKQPWSDLVAELKRQGWKIEEWNPNDVGHQPESAAAPHHAQRLQHLQKQLQERLSLLHQYEQQESTEDDPRRLRKIKQNIAREKEAIARLNDEIAALGPSGNSS